MPRYYFDIAENGSLSRDEFGDDLANFDEARAQAIGLLPDMAREALPDGESHVFACSVRDEADQPVYRCTLTFQGLPLVDA